MGESAFFSRRPRPDWEIGNNILQLALSRPLEQILIVISVQEKNEPYTYICNHYDAFRFPLNVVDKYHTSSRVTFIQNIGTILRQTNLPVICFLC